MYIKLSRSESGYVDYTFYQDELFDPTIDLKKKNRFHRRKSGRELTEEGTTRGKISRYIAIINNLVCG